MEVRVYVWCVYVQARTFPIWEDGVRGALRGARVPYVGRLTWIHPCVRGESPARSVRLAWAVCVRVCTSPARGSVWAVCVPACAGVCVCVRVRE